MHTQMAARVHCVGVEYIFLSTNPRSSTVPSTFLPRRLRQSPFSNESQLFDCHQKWIRSCSLSHVHLFWFPFFPKSRIYPDSCHGCQRMYGVHQVHGAGCQLCVLGEFLFLVWSLVFGLKIECFGCCLGWMMLVLGSSDTRGFLSRPVEKSDMLCKEISKL